MKKIICCCAIFITLVTSGQNYQLVWSDEFDSTSLDLNNWTRETGGWGWGNAESQYYTDREVNSFIENGSLVIKAMKENYSGSIYTSARLKTQGKQFFKYGKIEARIKLPYGKGIWPAFWMLGENITTVGWPACGEIDIVELVGGGSGDKTIHGSAHWDNGGHRQSSKSYSLLSGKFADSFHLFAITWNKNEIAWYVDGIRYHSIDIRSPALDEFQNNAFILLNIAVGGNWPGYPDTTTVFPQIMKVDYVRVYKDVATVPTITINEPINGASILPNGDVKINAAADVSSGTIQNVEFFQDAVKIGETNIPPYEITWRDVEAGCYTIWAKATSNFGYFGSSDTVRISVGSGCPQAPYKGNANFVPGVIEAEDYDLGGENESFHDSDTLNNGGKYRGDAVDIEECSDTGGGYNVGWINSGEWLEYSVYVSKTANYDAVFRVASGITGGRISMQIDGAAVFDNLTVSSTGDWQSWSDIVTSGFSLNEGKHVLRINFDNGLFNFNKFTLYETGSEPSLTLIQPNGGEEYLKNSVQEILWRADRVETIKIGLTTDDGNNWSFVTFGTDSKFGSFRWLTPDILSDKCFIMILSADDFNIRDTSNSSFAITDAVGVNKIDIAPIKFNLDQNYPNPFNPSTVIKYQMPKSGNVKLVIYDMLGRKVKTLVNGFRQKGRYEIRFDAKELSSGIYIYKIQANEFTASRKMMLIK